MTASTSLGGEAVQIPRAMSAQAAAISVRSVSKRFGSTEVLNGLDLDVAAGTITAVVGQSGSGKTTLLRIIAGFDHCDKGQVWLGDLQADDGAGVWVQAQHRGVGYVPQEGGLFPHMTVAGNAGYGLARRSRGRVGDLLQLVGLAELASRYPHELSGGQQQRVALARALAVEPRIVLLDEPFSSLDESMREQVRREVRQILVKAGMTAVIVTHDQGEAMSMADQMAVLKRGRIVASGDPRALYNHPPGIDAVSSLGEANLLRATASAGSVRCALGDFSVTVGDDPAFTGPVEIMIRPEQITLVAPTERAATVVEISYHGHDSLVRLVSEHWQDASVAVRVSGEERLELGEEFDLAVRGPAMAWAVSEGPEG